MRYMMRAGLAVATLAVTAPAGSAQATAAAPNVLSVTCEVVKHGMQAAHDQHEERWARATEATQKWFSVAVSSMTGQPETCWLSGGASLDANGKAFEAALADRTYGAQYPAFLRADAEFVSSVRTFNAILRADLSAGPMPNVLSRRVLEWSEFRVRPGAGETLFANAVKAYRGAMERAGLKPDFRVYQVRHGLPAATYWVLHSGTSLAQFDASIAADPKIAAAYTPEDLKALDEYFGRAHVSVVTNVYAYVPAQSTLTPEQRASDPFWARR